MGGRAASWPGWLAGRAGRAGWPAGRCIAAHSAGPTVLWTVPPIRSLTMHLPAGPSYMPATSGHAGESGVGDFAKRLRLISGANPLIYTDVWMHRAVDLLPEHVRDGRGSLGECRGIDFRGRGFGCQTLSKARSGPPNTFAHDASSRGPVVHVHAGMRGEWRRRLCRKAQARFLFPG